MRVMNLATYLNLLIIHRHYFIWQNASLLLSERFS